MNILITGSSGFVGAHLIARLLDDRHTVSGIGHRSDIASPRISHHEVDLLDAAAVEAFDFRGFDAIIHLAGLAAVGPSYTQARRYIDANAGMQVNLFEACIGQGLTPRVLVISTGNVYQAVKLPLHEDSPLVASSPYAVSKITQEYLGRYYARRNFEVIIARPFNHIGPGQAEGFIVSDLAKQIVEAEREKSGVIQVGNLTSSRDYTDVRDIVKAYAALITSGTPGEVYNVSSGRSHSGQQILDGLLKHTACDISITQDESRMRPAEVQDIYGSYEKLQRDTGWKPEIPLEQTLADALADWRQRLA